MSSGTVVSKPIIYFDNNDILYKLKLVFTNSNKIITETYTKNIININTIQYDDIVICERVIKDKESNLYIKEQRPQGFILGQTNWINVQTKKL